MRVPGPDINTRVDVDVAGWTEPRPSRVEDLDGDLVVADPLVGGPDRDPPIGSPVTVTWTGPSGPMELLTTLAAKEDRAIALWRLDPQGSVVVNQRRDHVRVPTMLTLVLDKDGRRIHGHLVDLSEGGFRAACVAPVPVQVGDHLDAAFEFDRQVTEIGAEVVRLERQGDHVFAGCRFLDVPAKKADLIRRFVFARQCRERSLR